MISAVAARVLQPPFCCTLCTGMKKLLFLFLLQPGFFNATAQPSERIKEVKHQVKVSHVVATFL